MSDFIYRKNPNLPSNRVADDRARVAAAAPAPVARIADLEKENADLRIEVDVWRRRAKKKEDLLMRYQRAGARRAD